MTILPKYLRSTEEKYFSVKSPDAFTKDLNAIFSKSFLDLSSNWRGQFINEKEFKVTRKFNFLVSDIPFDFAIIYGTINTIDNKTTVNLRVTQNKSLVFLYVLSLFVGLLCLSASIIRPDKPNWLEVFIGGLTFTFIVPLVLVLIGHLNKKIFKNDFTKLLNLTGK